MNPTEDIFWNKCEFVCEVGLEQRIEKINHLCQILGELKDTEEHFPGGNDDVQFVIQFNPPQPVAFVLEGVDEEHRTHLKQAASISVKGALLSVQGELAFWNGTKLFLFAEQFPIPFRYKAPEFIEALNKRNAQVEFDFKQVIRDNEELIENFFQGLETDRSRTVEQLEKDKMSLERRAAKMNKEAQLRRHNPKR